MRTLLSLTLFCVCLAAMAQPSLYYPPLQGDTWDKVDPVSLGWCPDKIDSLSDFLEAKNSRAFIVLHQGKIAIERYYDGADSSSQWYWASAGKSLMAFLVGMAQEEGLLDIHDSTSQYLGTGWTSATPAQEGQITLFHQLTMTTGLDDGVSNPDCLVDTCLQYLAPPYTRWAYYNAPYRLLQDVVANASGQTINQFTNDRLRTRIGMKGLWLDYIRYGRARDMARFGLLMLGQGVWNGDTLLGDTSYLQAMTSSSQSMNPSYGYLWWLNGQGAYMLPTLQFQFQTDLTPNAPVDMYSALGKNDQKIYVVPSLDLVVIRQGESAGNVQLAASSFDNELWGKLNPVFCGNATAVETVNQRELKVYPNPATETLTVQLPLISPGPLSWQLYNLMGERVAAQTEAFFPERVLSIPVHFLPQGLYTLVVETGGQRWQQTWIRE